MGQLRKIFLKVIMTSLVVLIRIHAKAEQHLIKPLRLGGIGGLRDYGFEFSVP